MLTKTIAFSLPQDVGREVLQEAKEEGLTLSELVLKLTRLNRAKRSFNALAVKARKLAKEQGLKEEDFGGPFDR